MSYTAEIIADSISLDGVRLTTMQLRYPKFIHGEFLTHRVFSRNSSSSRAIPAKRIREDIENDPAIPVYWGKNKPGMQAGEQSEAYVAVDEFVECRSESHKSGLYEKQTRYLPPDSAWLKARNDALKWQGAFAKAGYHKQITNRITEPYVCINTVVTATEWDNFFKLRCHPDAQPEIRRLAITMKNAMEFSLPAEIDDDGLHAPYVDMQDIEELHFVTEKLLESNVDADFYSLLNANIFRISSARCARVSYKTHEGKYPTIEKDFELCDDLLKAPHLSPFEHQAYPDTLLFSKGWQKPHLHGNFVGWKQNRKMIENSLRKLTKGK